MVLSAQAQRSWKLATAVCTSASAFHLVLYTEYSMPAHLAGEKHVFTDIQQAYRGMIDKHVWNLPDQKEQQQRQLATAGKQQQ
mmetsp:Transcript_23212/g.27952  ORF Transcript_23212/g.27952 Transcript_23212/m.27952 type:complete len:83 (-) Transcript_23212:192-440(-)